MDGMMLGRPNGYKSVYEDCTLTNVVVYAKFVRKLFGRSGCHFSRCE